MRCPTWNEKCPDPEWCMQGGPCDAARLDAGLPIVWRLPPENGPGRFAKWREKWRIRR